MRSRLLLPLVGSIGVILSLYDFLQNRSLWLDEAMLALNLMDRGYEELLQPLDRGQMAPPLYLLLTKAVSIVFHYSEQSLRAVPLICFWVSIFLLGCIAKALHFPRSITAFALLMFCLNASTLNYATEVKQYSVDVFTGCMLCYSALRTYESALLKAVCLAALGSLCIFLSFITPIILVAVGAHLLWEAWHKRIPWLFLGIPFLLWLGCYGLFYVEFVRANPVRSVMEDAWRNHFAPAQSVSGRLWSMLWPQTRLAGTDVVEFDDIGRLFLPVYALGIVRLWRARNYSALVFLLVPLLTHFALSALRLYPSAKRLNLYQAPFLILLFAQGVAWVAERIRQKWERFPLFLFLLFPCLLAKQVAKDYPRRKEEMKPMFRVISSQGKPTDTLYVSHGGVSAFEYYQKRGLAPLTSHTVFGVVPRANPARQQEQLEQLEGRTWVLFSHFYKREKNATLAALDTLGTRTLQKKTKGTEVYLFEFTPAGKSAGVGGSN